MRLATADPRAGSRIHRHVEHVMGMPISLALRGRHAADSAGRAAWAGGVVKGWAVERVAGHLRELADTDFCLSAGGDIICDTVTEDARPWRIGIEDPRDTRRLIAVIPLRAGAVATSGTAHRGAHLVDPRTAQPPTGIASVTVIDTSLTWADIDATAAYVHGRDAARWLQSRPIRSGLVVLAEGTTTLIARHIDRTRSTNKKEVVP